MSRAAVYDALAGNDALNELGITEDSVFANYSLDESPVTNGPFLILRWENEDRPVFSDPNQSVVKNTRNLTVWAHIPAVLSTDFNRLDAILNSVDDALVPMVHVAGEDGEVVTSVRAFGRSSDFKDEGFKTISRNATYQILSRKG